MDNLEKNLQEVHSKLHNEPLVKEYLSLKKQIEESKYLTTLQKELVVHEKAMALNMDNDDIYFKEKELYESIKDKLDKDPLISNFKNVSEELLILLNEVKQVLL